jgi:hypothetical protein
MNFYVEKIGQAGTEFRTYLQRAAVPLSYMTSLMEFEFKTWIDIPTNNFLILIYCHKSLEPDMG